jgi:hypothetical protein
MRNRYHFVGYEELAIPFCRVELAIPICRSSMADQSNSVQDFENNMDFFNNFTVDWNRSEYGFLI